LQSHWDELAEEIRVKLDEFDQSFQEKADALVIKLSELKSASKSKRRLIKLEIRRLNEELRATWKAWLTLTAFTAERYQLAREHSS